MTREEAEHALMAAIAESRVAFALWREQGTDERDADFIDGDVAVRAAYRQGVIAELSAILATALTGRTGALSEVQRRIAELQEAP